MISDGTRQTNQRNMTTTKNFCKRLPSTTFANDFFRPLLSPTHVNDSCQQLDMMGHDMIRHDCYASYVMLCYAKLYYCTLRKLHNATLCEATTLRQATLRYATLCYATLCYAAPTQVRYALLMAQRRPGDAVPSNPNSTAPPTRRTPGQSQQHSATHTTPSPPIPMAQRHHSDETLPPDIPNPRHPDGPAHRTRQVPHQNPHGTVIQISALTTPIQANPKGTAPRAYRARERSHF